MRSLNEEVIELRFAEMKDSVKDKLKRFGLFTEIGEQSFFIPLARLFRTISTPL